jgi:hypothetical protein
MDLLSDLSLPVKIWPMPVEIPNPIRFTDDTAHASYDPEYAHRFWQILVQVERVLNLSRCSFVGKCSPVHFFWGAMDLAVTRFSGRPAPPREGPEFMRESYSNQRGSGPHRFCRPRRTIIRSSPSSFFRMRPCGPLPIRTKRFSVS